MSGKRRDGAEHVGAIQSSQGLDSVQIDHVPLRGFLLGLLAGFWAGFWAGLWAGF